MRIEIDTEDIDGEQVMDNAFYIFMFLAAGAMLILGWLTPIQFFDSGAPVYDQVIMASMVGLGTVGAGLFMLIMAESRRIICHINELEDKLED